MFLVLSYPRSGNHLVRFFIEYVTGRATLGCIDNPTDRPIAADEFESPDVLAHVDQGRAIAHKAHTPGEVRQITQAHRIEGLIVIRRDPVEAILAHVDRPRHDLGNLRFRRRLRRNVKDYLDVMRFYAEAPGPRLLLRYEDWITNDPAAFRAELDKLAALLGKAVIPARLAEAKAHFEALRRLSANPRKRAWKGFRSNGQKSFHQHALPQDIVALVQREARALGEIDPGSSEVSPAEAPDELVA